MATWTVEGDTAAASPAITCRGDHHCLEHHHHHQHQDNHDHHDQHQHQNRTNLSKRAGELGKGATEGRVVAAMEALVCNNIIIMISRLENKHDDDDSRFL